MTRHQKCQLISCQSESEKKKKIMYAVVGKSIDIFKSLNSLMSYDERERERKRERSDLVVNEKL